MSAAATRRISFEALLLLLPVPFFAAAVEIAPLLRLAFLAAVLGAIVVADGAAGAGGLLAGLLLAQGLLYVGLLWGAAWLAARGLAGAAPRLRAGIVGAPV